MTPHRPYTLIAELTYRCPLHCAYCSNPVDYASATGAELSTDDWLRILGEAEALGVVQVHFTGGEPLARKDLESLVARARALGLYANLITSGVPLTRARMQALADAGIDNVQLSVQHADAEGTRRVADLDAFDAKIAAAAWVKELGLPLTVNVVLHRENLDRVGDLIALAERLGADRLELANTQYHGFALTNRDALLPTRAQLDAAFAIASGARARLHGKMELVYVRPDYFSDVPKACMDGWARRYIHMTPDGTALPCHAARSLKHLAFPSVREHALAWIWEESPAFQAYRGEAWMKEPCASCDARGRDFGGCRCQAFALTGDAAAADPSCTLAPGHGIVTEARLRASHAASTPEGAKRMLVYRGRPAR